MKKLLFFPMAIAAVLTVTSCSDDDNNSNGNNDGQVTAEANTEVTSDYNFDAIARQIALSDNTATTDDESVKVVGSKITITQAGTYSFTGTLSNGQIVVDADRDDVVKIQLNGVTVTSSNSAAIDIENADKVILKLAPNTINTFSDAYGNILNSTIYSRTKLSIFGTGILNVNGNESSAIQSEGGIVMKEGVFNIGAIDNAVISNYNIDIFSGTATVDTQGNGFDAGTDINVHDGYVDVNQSSTGMEASAVHISGGIVRIEASSDGINADGESTSANNEIYVEDGYLYINSSGNGFVSAGSIKIDAGTVILDGPTTTDNAAVVYDSTFKIDGGKFIAVNAAGNLNIPSSGSSQNSLIINFNETINANTLVHLQTAEGTDIVTFKPSKSFQTIVISSPDIDNNATLQVYTGGTATGASPDGLYNLINYTGGTLRGSFTVDGKVTSINTSEL